MKPKHLSAFEIKYVVPVIKKYLESTTDSKTTKYSSEIVNWVNMKFESISTSKFTDFKLRVAVNLLRRQKFPIISGNNGYYVSYDEDKIVDIILNLNSRRDSMKSAIKGLKSCLKNIRNEK